MAHWSIRKTARRQDQVARLGRATGLGGDFSAVIDYALSSAISNQLQEVEMDKRKTAELAESIYSAVYGDIDNRGFHRDRVQEIEDWLTDGEPLEGDETVDDLARQWHQEHAGDDEIIDAVGASNWIQVELEYCTMSRADILRTLDRMMPTEENEELAARIYVALH